MTTEAPDVRAATFADVAALVDVLARAFADDPVLGWLLPDDPSRNRRLRRFFDLEVRHVVLPAGTVWTTDTSDGVALALPPHAWRMPLRAQAAHAPTFAHIFGRRLPAAFALITLMEHRHLREPHVYLPYIGVAPPAQGRGTGSRLLKTITARCDRHGHAAYLEATSERNATLYERHGFEHLGPFHLRSSPPLWPMRRPPR